MGKGFEDVTKCRDVKSFPPIPFMKGYTKKLIFALDFLKVLLQHSWYFVVVKWMQTNQSVSKSATYVHEAQKQLFNETTGNRRQSIKRSEPMAIIKKKINNSNIASEFPQWQ